MNTDTDRDTQKLVLVDGGMRGTTDPARAANIQSATWPSRINRNGGGYETQYFDFVVDIPTDTGSPGTYWGYVGVSTYEARLFGNKIELWQGTNLLATYNVTLASGRHNIGICAGFDAPGVWLDGSLVISAAIPVLTSPSVTFGSKAWDDPNSLPVTYVPGAVLLENLCYVKAFHRADAGEPAALPGQPVVHVTQFDGPRPCTVYDPVNVNGNWSPMKVVEVGACGGRVTVTHGASSETTISLASGRRVAGVLITDDADGLVYADGDLLENPDGPAPGVSTYVFTDAVGASYCYDRVLPDLPADPSTYGMTGNTPVPPVFDYFYVAIGLGKHSGPTGRRPEPTSANPWVPEPDTGSGLATTEDGRGINSGSANGPCTCGATAVEKPTNTVETTDASTGNQTNHNGAFGNFPPGIMFGPSNERTIPLEETANNGRVPYTGHYNPKSGETVVEDGPGACKLYKPELEQKLGTEVRIPKAEPGGTDPSQRPGFGSSDHTARDVAYHLVGIAGHIAVLVAAAGLLGAPDPSFVSKLAAGCMIAGATTGIAAHIGHIINAVKGEEVIDERSLKILEWVALGLELAGAVLALPSEAQMLIRALAERKARTQVATVVAEETLGTVPRPPTPIPTITPAVKCPIGTTGQVANNTTSTFSRVVRITERNLQKGFTKHGGDFGLSGNWNPSRAAEFSRAIHQHINNGGVRAINGTYRGKPVVHYLDPATGVNVIVDQAGNYVSGWRLGAEQLKSVLATGRLW